jgi:hypothetical protein
MSETAAAKFGGARKGNRITEIEFRAPPLIVALSPQWSK